MYLDLSKGNKYPGGPFHFTSPKASALLRHEAGSSGVSIWVPSLMLGTLKKDFFASWIQLSFFFVLLPSFATV